MLDHSKGLLAFEILLLLLWELHFGETLLLVFRKNVITWWNTLKGLNSASNGSKSLNIAMN